MAQNGTASGSLTDLASVASKGHGTMLWFNAVKDLGALRTDDGTRIEVPGGAFAAGEKPCGRCAGLEIEFELETNGVSEIAFVHAVAPRRARIRQRR
jgi:hypothetical protein